MREARNIECTYSLINLSPLFLAQFHYCASLLGTLLLGSKVTVSFTVVLVPGTTSSPAGVSK